MVNHLKVVFYLYRIGIIDAFSMLKFSINVGAQYLSCVGCSCVGNDTYIQKIFEPIVGLSVAYEYIKDASNALDKRKRIQTVAAFLAVSFQTTSLDPVTNIAIGAAVNSKIEYMRNCIVKNRGGYINILSRTSVKIRSNSMFLVQEPVKSVSLIKHLGMSLIKNPTTTHISHISKNRPLLMIKNSTENIFDVSNFLCEFRTPDNLTLHGTTSSLH